MYRRRSSYSSGSSSSILMPLVAMLLVTAGSTVGRAVGRYIEASNAENNSLETPLLDTTVNIDVPVNSPSFTLASGRKIEDLFKDAAGNSNAEKVSVIFEGDTATLEKNPRGGYLLIYEKK